MDAILPIAAVVGFLLLAGAIIVIAVMLEKKRTEAIALVAQQLGLEFNPEGVNGLVDKLDHLPLFNKGRRKRAKNHMAGEVQGVQVSLFDYRYTTGSGKNSHTWNQSVVCIESGHINLVDFTISPENFLHKLGSAFGYQDIDFDSHPEFSKKFLLRGSDEQAIRQLFLPAILEWFEGHIGVTAEANGDTFVFFRASRRAKPEQIPELLKEGLSLFKELASQ